MMSFIKKHLPFILFLIILAVGAFLRLYRIGDYMGFLGDEGRDALIVKRMLVDHKFTLLGPITSVGLMHLGPMYYYFMLPFLWIFQLNPVGPAVMVALFSLGTIYLIWHFCKEFINIKSALIASLFYALSPIVIVHSHSSWNPNILPFWAMLIIYSITKIIVSKQFSWFIVTGLSLGIILQLHYVALVFFPIIAVLLIIFKVKIPFKFWILGLLGFILTYSPFILFELRHQFINTQTVWDFVIRSGQTKTFGFVSPLNKFWDLTVRLIWRLLIIENAELSIAYLYSLIIGTVVIFKFFKTKDQYKKIFIILFIWYFIGISCLSLYTGSVYDYYLMFVFPLPFILSGMIFSEFSKKTIGRICIGVLIIFICYFQIKQTPILKPPNKLAVQTRNIAEFVLQKTQNQPYNFALIAGKNSDHAYRYFLEILGNYPITIENPQNDPLRKTVTQQLLVVCEEEVCNPLGNPIWEIAGFGRAEIENEWQLQFVKVFKLIHYQ